LSTFGIFILTNIL